MNGGKLSYRFLGGSGLKVSEICLGTMTFGERKDGLVQCSENESHAILDKFVEMGGNFIDTADIYCNGLSEEILGNWLKKNSQKRERYVIATKLRSPMSDHANGCGLSRSHIMQAVDDSLRRLRTSYIDLYQIHCWDDGVPIEETVSAMNDLVRMGKVRYVGASNVLGWQMQKIVELCRQKGYQPWVSLQQQYNLLCRQSEFEVFDVCQNEGVGVLPWSPLKGGWLSGKIRRETTSSSLDPKSRIGWASEAAGRANQAAPSYDQFANEKTWKLLDLMESIGQKHGKSVAQVALRWLLEKNVVSSVVIGVKTLKQLEENCGAAIGWKMTADEVSALDEASEYDVPYPYEMVRRLNKDRKRNKIA
ncbi:hypothetical protein CAPTEDRAFT_20923 [Capitella teleta]|uniref:NADP-dependent oxidoreductase domain-containing protein n=1 Tax=Capitella teleta TaxID=283909 RepID=R7U074_CAPTE|nr:hypothetical protein CAPTEDRAFT_20923 [Capitella teleta]|eukprot:ELT99608.1 hypothetical protein CAPTEDRAFT_20923 [Capitella teleta]